MNAPSSLGTLHQWILATLTPHYGAGEATGLARLMEEDLLHYTPVDVVLHKDTEIPPSAVAKIEKVVDRLLHDEPIQYILGSTTFYGATLVVTPDVLIPRPETEQLIDIIVRDWESTPDLCVLDMATGSGCIAATLARVLRFPNVEALDISDAALAVAAVNAERSRVKVSLSHADILNLDETFKPTSEYDIIVSNPPYVLESEASRMEANVIDYEPHIALFVPDADPLKFYKPIARFAAKHLSERGKLYLEINPICSDSLTNMLKAAGFDSVTIATDSFGRKRFAIASISR